MRAEEEWRARAGRQPGSHLLAFHLARGAASAQPRLTVCAQNTGRCHAFLTRAASAGWQAEPALRRHFGATRARSHQRLPLTCQAGRRRTRFSVDTSRQYSRGCWSMQRAVRIACCRISPHLTPSWRSALSKTATYFGCVWRRATTCVARVFLRSAGERARDGSCTHFRPRGRPTGR